MSAKSNDSLLPAYLIVGDDALKRDAVIKRLRLRVEEKGDLSLNYDEFDGAVASGDEIVQACNTMPFIGTLRLILVRSADKLPKAECEQVISYLGACSSASVLALEAEKLAKNTRLYKAVASISPRAVIECASPAKRDLPSLVRSMAVSHGVTFTDAAARALVELVGENTVHLDGEVRKIALACRGGKQITPQDVQLLTSRTAEPKPWEFVDAFASRDMRSCLRLLALIRSVTPIALLTMCTNRLRELVCARSLIERGDTGLGHLSEALGDYQGRKPQGSKREAVKEWKARIIQNQARNYSSEELRKAIVASSYADMSMKSGIDADVVFFDWMVSVLRKR